MRMLILSGIANVYTKFQNARYSNSCSWEFFDENFYWRKREKWTDKGNDKYEDGDSLLHNTSSRT